ncbi:hypothetical protein [Nostoc sp. TCL240-02]|uniref:hypothetical protein n=1 Tax=Nostoc sp. TCL240-02 TaxID=2572090 RepID=UPI0034A09EFD
MAWCQERFPNSTVNYVVADLFAVPAQQWHLGFDFVFECRNIQALPLNVRYGHHRAKTGKLYAKAKSLPP